MTMVIETRLATRVCYDETPLGVPGNEGAAYKVVDSPAFAGYCVKIYHPDKRDQDRERKIDYMIRNVPADMASPRYLLCWPREIVVDTRGKFLGFLMPMGPADGVKLYDLVTSKLPMALRGSDWEEKFERTTNKGFENRLKICGNIAVALHTIQQSGKYVMVDYKPQNILISPEGKISLLDIDSFQVSTENNVLFRAGAFTPEYAPPESVSLDPGKDAITVSWDQFSLAVSFYQLLYGLHPYAASAKGAYAGYSTMADKIKNGLFVYGPLRDELAVIPKPHEAFLWLPKALQELFLRAFGVADGRPTAAEWGAAIAVVLDEGSVIVPAPPIVIVPPVAATAPPEATKVSPAIPKAPQVKVAPVRVAPVKVAKKKDYMIYKIFCVLLAVACFMLYWKWQGTLEDVQIQKAKASASDERAATFFEQLQTDEARLRSLQEKTPSDTPEVPK